MITVIDLILTCIIIYCICKIIIYKPKKNLYMDRFFKEMNKEEKEMQKRIIAWHEVGHALMAKELNLKVSEITTLPEIKNKNQLVYGRTTVHFKNNLKSKKQFENEIKIFYGGRCAELILFNYDEDLITDGCSGDIKQATLRIDSYINNLGFSKTTGMLNLDLLNHQPNEVIEEMKQLSKRLEKETLEYLKSKKELIEIIVEKLMEKDKINEKELDTLIQDFNERKIDNSNIQ